MGPGPGAAGFLNSSLTAEQRILFQDATQIKRLLAEVRTIAVIGLSADRQKASFFVANYLRKLAIESSR